MLTTGLEVARFWVVFCIFVLLCMPLGYFGMIKEATVMIKMWFFIPEAIFSLLILGRLLIAIVTIRKKLPGCNCSKSQLLLRVGSNVVLPLDDLPLLVRLPQHWGRACGIYALLGCIVGLTAAAINLPITRIRLDALASLTLLAFMMNALQSTHYICMWHWNSLMVEVSLLQINLDNMVPEGLEDIVVHRPPADVSNYMTDLSEKLLERVSECPICSEAFQIPMQVTVLPCSHVYHEVCVATWLGANPSCPICRARVSPLLMSERMSSIES